MTIIALLDDLFMPEFHHNYSAVDSAWQDVVVRAWDVYEKEPTLENKIRHTEAALVYWRGLGHVYNIRVNERDLEMFNKLKNGDALTPDEQEFIDLFYVYDGKMITRKRDTFK